MSRTNHGPTFRSVLCVLCSLCVLCLPACGYSLAGRGSFLPAYIKTMGIPTFANRTVVFNLETMVTQKVRSEFIGRGKYQILPEATGVDALLTGEVTAVTSPVSSASTPVASGRIWYLPRPMNSDRTFCVSIVSRLKTTVWLTNVGTPMVLM